MKKLMRKNTQHPKWIYLELNTGWTFTSLSNAASKGLSGVTARGLARHLNGQSKQIHGWRFVRMNPSDINIIRIR